MKVEAVVKPWHIIVAMFVIITLGMMAGTGIGLAISWYSVLYTTPKIEKYWDGTMKSDVTEDRIKKFKKKVQKKTGGKNRK